MRERSKHGHLVRGWTRVDHRRTSRKNRALVEAYLTSDDGFAADFVHLSAKQKWLALEAVSAPVGMFTLSAPSDAASKAKRITKPHYAAQPRYPRQEVRRYSREEVECERAQAEDPAGDFAGYPCWARAAAGVPGRGVGGEGGALRGGRP